MNTPENRELTAEIMFETFNVKGLYIAVQVRDARRALQSRARRDRMPVLPMPSGLPQPALARPSPP